MKRELTVAEVAYLAAMVDGEGAISILRMRMKRPSGVYLHYAVQVRIANTAAVLHDWIQERCGGAVYDHSASPLGNRKPGYSWHLGGHAARAFLELVRPYLVIKGRQADLALKFLKFGREFVPHLRAELYAEMRQLNQRGVSNTTADGSVPVTRKLAQPDLWLLGESTAGSKGE